MDRLSHIQRMLDTIPFEGDEAEPGAMESVIVAVRQLEEPRAAVPMLLRWFEANGEYDLGNPGPFVHFIEEQLDYIPALEESLATRPTYLTVWMANRVANGEADPVKIGCWVNILRNVVQHSSADGRCKERAESFAIRQASR